ncbi:hypothetical protein QGM71_06340 [Virgibacillus sp. C22-A2]|uniref:YpzI family protein n=1 Tax=Virgibacillus tibetensis TaxID=3042313 RepID=A0ABU6KCR3_9BACI|nr:hypothetical protein [Virgibacillus sp. C22-A2]
MNRKQKEGEKQAKNGKEHRFSEELSDSGERNEIIKEQSRKG